MNNVVVVMVLNMGQTVQLVHRIVTVATTLMVQTALITPAFVLMKKIIRTVQTDAATIMNAQAIELAALGDGARENQGMRQEAHALF